MMPKGEPADFCGSDAPPIARQDQIGLRAPVGSGKTRDMIEAVRDLVTTNSDGAAVVFVPNHKLAREWRDRLAAALPAGVAVEVWLGADQPDPDAPSDAPRRMCERGDVVRHVIEAGGERTDVCGSKLRGYCPHHPDAGGACGYVAQGRKRARVWVLTHAMLHRAPPDNLRRFGRGPADLILIDECFWPGMLGGTGARPVKVELSALGAGVFANVPDRGDIPGLRTKRLGSTLTALAGVLDAAAPGACVDGPSLSAAGLSGDRLREARTLALSCKVTLPRAGLAGADGGADGGAVAALLGSVGPDNRIVLAAASLLRIAADVADGRIGPAGLRIGESAGARWVFLRWREDIHPAWMSAARVIHADATMDETIVRRWLPNLVLAPVAPAAAPHMRVVQIGDRSFGYSSIGAGRALAGQAPRPAAQAIQANMQRLAHTLGELSKRYAGAGRAGGPDVLAIGPKRMVAALRAKGSVPANVGTAHFGALRGLDAFKGVGVLLLVSRLLPAAHVVEDEAELIFGPGIARLATGDFYPKRPARLAMKGGGSHPVGGGGAYYHPDPRAEAVRRAHCEAELTQAVGRGRGTLRTAGNPLDVVILTNTPVEGVEVDEVCSLDDVWRELGGDCLARPLLEAGVLPSDWAGIGAMLTARGMLPACSDPGAAARMRFARDPAAETALGAARKALGARVPHDPHSITFIMRIVRNSHGPWTPFTYRRRGSRQSARVLIDPRHADPKAEAERLLGPLASFAPASVRARSNRGQTPPREDAPALPAPPAPKVQSPEPVPLAALPALEAAPDPLPAPSTSNAPAPVRPGPCDPEAPAQAPRPDLEARIASVQLGLPPVLNALQAAGRITKAERQRLLDWFRRMPGARDARERVVLADLARQVGPPALQAAARQAALATLGGAGRAPG